MKLANKAKNWREYANFACTSFCPSGILSKERVVIDGFARLVSRGEVTRLAI